MSDPYVIIYLVREEMKWNVTSANTGQQTSGLTTKTEQVSLFAPSA